jgi:hypothetical protein
MFSAPTEGAYAEAQTKMRRAKGSGEGEKKKNIFGDQ